MSKNKRSYHPFAFVHTVQCGASGSIDTISYDSITKKLKRNNKIMKELNDADETNLRQTFSSNGFFDVATFFYPGTRSADNLQNSLLATMDGKGTCIIWSSDSVDIPQGIANMGDVIGGHGPVGPGG
jgi:hypothetical protein